jgi:predicted nucleotidyltransferase
MPPIVQELVRKQIIKSIPSHVPEGIQYETIMGSFAYGVSSDTSDCDVYGFSIPDKSLVFPHLNGEIEGFGPKGPRFEVWTQHHIKDETALGNTGREYDFSIYSIIKYFDLVMNANPNMIDSLFVPVRCITHITPIGQMVRDNRHLFLSKKAWHSFKGYSYQQIHKIRTKSPTVGSKRREMIEEFGYDVKFAYHVVRLMNEIEQILTEGDLDLERSREQLKSIRRGDWTVDQIERYFMDNETRLAKLYDASSLPHKPRMEEIKQLLLDCLEQHFGTLQGAIQTIDPALRALNDIEQVLLRFRNNEGNNLHSP